MSSARPSEFNVGDYFLRPWTIAAVGLLLINDHVLKGRAPGVITGKLSDAAGLIVFPMLLTLTAESAGPGRWKRLRIAAWSALGTGIVFGCIKLVPGAADVYGTALGLVRWMLFSPGHLVSGAPLGRPRAVITTHDLSDLMMLPAVAVSYMLMTMPKGHRATLRSAGAAAASWALPERPAPGGSSRPRW